MLISPNHEPTLSPPYPRYGVLASGSGSNFEALIHAQARGALLGELGCLICNNPGAGALKRAQDHDIPAHCINHREFDSRASFDQAIIQALDSHQIDWVVMAGWMRIVSKGFIEAFDSRVLNIHPSLLPSFKGAHAVEDALMAGVKITGCTVHMVIADLDAGPIIAQAAVPILADDDVSSLHARIQEQEHALYPRAIMIAVEAYHQSHSSSR